MLSEYVCVASSNGLKISNSLVDVPKDCVKENEFLSRPSVAVPECLLRTDQQVYNVNNKNKPNNKPNSNRSNSNHNNKMSDVNVGLWRPRGALARALMDRMKNDEYLDSLDQSKWYTVSLDDMDSRSRLLWHPLTMDGATKRWLAGARTTASNLPLQIYHSLARLFLGMFMTQTDVNGWLHRGSMFVLSTNQLSSLLISAGYYGKQVLNNTSKPLELKSKHEDKNNEKQISNHSRKPDIDDSAIVEGHTVSNGVNSSYDTEKLVKNDKHSTAFFPVKGHLLDIGAGDGEITARMEPLFEDISVTEISGTMRERLAQRGYNVLDVETWMSEGPYDVISCLNLLDRCSNPKSLLHDVRLSLKPNGLILIALVLPFKPYVEKGTKDHRPTEYLEVHGSTFEQQVESFFNVLEELGFEIKTWSRVPYLCHGDLNQSYYHLDDIIVVASKKETN